MSFSKKPIYLSFALGCLGGCTPTQSPLPEEGLALQKQTSAAQTITLWPEDGQQKTEVAFHVGAAHYETLKLPEAARWILDIPGEKPGWLVITEDAKTWFIQSAEPSDKLTPTWERTSRSFPDYPFPLWQAPAYNTQTATWDALSQPSPEAVISRPPATSASCAQRVVLEQASTRYPHGIFAQNVEPSAWSLYNGSSRLSQEIKAPDVIESYQPLLLSNCSILLTLSNAEMGSRLHLYRAAGNLKAKSQAIGTGFRWMHMLGSARFADDLPEEIIAVHTPHIGGKVTAYQEQGDQLVVSAQLAGYTSHPNRTQNLSLALIGRFDTSDWPGVLIPRQNKRTLSLLKRKDATWIETEHWNLNSEMSTNLRLAHWPESKYTGLALGTADGTLHLWSKRHD